MIQNTASADRGICSCSSCMEDTNFDKGWQAESLHHLHHTLHPSGIKLAVGWGVWIKLQHSSYCRVIPAIEHLIPAAGFVQFIGCVVQIVVVFGVIACPTGTCMQTKWIVFVVLDHIAAYIYTIS